MMCSSTGGLIGKSALARKLREVAEVVVNVFARPVEETEAIGTEIGVIGHNQDVLEEALEGGTELLHGFHNFVERRRCVEGVAHLIDLAPQLNLGRFAQQRFIRLTPVTERSFPSDPIGANVDLD